MLLKEQIKQIKSQQQNRKFWKEESKLVYPQDTSDGRYWHMFSCSGFKDKNADEDHPPDSALLVIQHNYRDGDSDFEIIIGAARILDEDFVEQWTELVRKGKAKVDALNMVLSEDKSVDAPGICAICNNVSSPGDFLCEDCRE